MIAARWASFTLAVLAAICLWFTEIGPASVVLAGFFLLNFTVLCWSFGAFQREVPDETEV